MPINGDLGVPDNETEKRQSRSGVFFVIAGTVMVTGATLVVELVGSGRLRPSLLAIPGILAVVSLGTLFHRFPGLADQLMRQLGGAVRGAVLWLRGRNYRKSRPRSHRPGTRLRGLLSSLWEQGWIRVLRGLLVYALIIALGVAAGREVGRRLPPVPSPSDAVPCRDPVELRALTPPENRDAVQSAADGFAADQARHRRCRPVHITVSAQVTFSDLVQGFAGRWQDPSRQPMSTGVAPLLGPPSDVWLPASTAEADYIVTRPHPDVTLDDEGSIATSPLVFAVPDDYTQRMMGNLSNPDAPTWSDLLAAASKAGLRVARPDPTVSETGLLATADLYRESHARADGTAVGNAAGNGARERRGIEEGIASLGAPVSDAHDLLCSIRGNPNPDVAVVVSEQALLDYDQAKPLGVGCPLPIARPSVSYTPFHPLDARVLDYPFVRITWQGQADSARDTMIERFRSWLAPGQLQGSGFRDRSGRTQSVQLPNTRVETAVRPFTGTEISRTITDYRRARQLVTVAFVIDVSGSMNNPTPERVSQLDRARELVAQALDFLGPSDAVGLSSFPGRRAKTDVTSFVRAEVAPAAADHLTKDLRPALAQLQPRGGSTPLYNAIDDASKSLIGKGDNPAVVVLSDGADAVDGGIGPAELGKRLAGLSDRPRIVVLATGPKGCDEPDVVALTAMPRTAVCYPAASGETERLTSLVFAELRKGRSP